MAIYMKRRWFKNLRVWYRIYKFLANGPCDIFEICRYLWRIVLAYLDTNIIRNWYQYIRTWYEDCVSLRNIPYTEHNLTGTPNCAEGGWGYEGLQGAPPPQRKADWLSLSIINSSKIKAYMEAYESLIFDTHMYVLKCHGAFAYEQRHDMQPARFPLKLQSVCWLQVWFQVMFFYV